MSRLDKLRKTMAAATVIVNDQVAAPPPIRPKGFEAAHRGLLVMPPAGGVMALVCKAPSLNIGDWHFLDDPVPQRSIHLCGEWRN